MSEIRKSLEENFKDQGNKENQLIPNQSNNYREYNISIRHQNQQINNIQEPFINNENTQIKLNQNDISSINQSENKIEDKASQQNQYSVPTPFTNCENSQNIILKNNNIQKKEEIGQSVNGNFMNNKVSNNYISPYMNSQLDYQLDDSPNNDLQLPKRKKKCCGPYDILGIGIGLILGTAFTISFPFIFSALIW